MRRSPVLRKIAEQGLDPSVPYVSDGSGNLVPLSLPEQASEVAKEVQDNSEPKEKEKVNTIVEKKKVPPPKKKKSEAEKPAEDAS